VRKLLAGLIVAVFVLALGTVAFAATQTISGQLIDQICYKMNKSNTGVDHKMPSGDEANCAATCAQMGQPVALLTSDGKVYTVTGGSRGEQQRKTCAPVFRKNSHSSEFSPTFHAATFSSRYS
jgi:hypothetical protein